MLILSLLFSNICVKMHYFEILFISLFSLSYVLLLPLWLFFFITFCHTVSNHQLNHLKQHKIILDILEDSFSTYINYIISLFNKIFIFSNRFEIFEELDYKSSEVSSIFKMIIFRFNISSSSFFTIFSNDMRQPCRTIQTITCYSK